MMNFDPFKDDSTGQFSMGRMCSFCILVFLIWSLPHGADIPPNWLMAMLAFYGINKLSSTTKEVKNVVNPVVGE